MPPACAQATAGKPVVVVDTREIEAYCFDPERVAVVRRALPAGDYSLDGFECRVAVERKTLDDFVTTVIRQRDRFHRELEKLRSYDAACVVVEANLTDVIGGRYRSGAHPHAILGAILSIVVDHGLPVFFCSDRQAAAWFTGGYLLRCHEMIGRRCQREAP
jgi:DNA excision repair protein ERCC-4